MTEAGHEIIKVRDCPIRFIKPIGARALPLPATGGRISDVTSLLNLCSEHAPLVATFALAALNPGIPQPVMNIEGPPGSAKTSTSRATRHPIDPHAITTTSPPKDERHIRSLFARQHLVAIDNLSTLSKSSSDLYCSIATGNTFTSGALYTNDGLHVAQLRRPLILNGIANVVTQPDLGDRCITLRLSPVRGFKSEGEIQRDLDAMQPRIFGLYLDALSTALRRFDEVRARYQGQPGLPRMFDAACWGEAAAPAFGWPDGYVMEALKRNRTESMVRSFEDDPVVVGAKLMVVGGERRDRPQQAYQYIRDRIGAEYGAVPPDFPKTASLLSAALTERLSVLRLFGVDFRTEKTSGTGSHRFWVFTRIEPEGVAGVASVAQGDVRPPQGNRSGQGLRRARRAPTLAA